MKKARVIWSAVAVALLAVVLAIVFVPGRERVSLTLLKYQRWPHGATLRLSNDTRRTVTYFTDQGGGIFLSQQKTADGWTNTSLPFVIARTLVRVGDGTFTREVITFEYPTALVKAGQPVIVARGRDLKPGQGAELYVGLEPDGLPVRVGTVCCVSQGALAKRFGSWIGCVKQWCHLKSTMPGQFEVWCWEPLQVSAKPTRAAGE